MIFPPKWLLEHHFHLVNCVLNSWCKLRQTEPAFQIPTQGCCHVPAQCKAQAAVLGENVASHPRHLLGDGQGWENGRVRYLSGRKPGGQVAPGSPRPKPARAAQLLLPGNGPLPPLRCSVLAPPGDAVNVTVHRSHDQISPRLAQRLSGGRHLPAEAYLLEAAREQPRPCAVEEEQTLEQSQDRAAGRLHGVALLPNKVALATRWSASSWELGTLLTTRTHLGSEGLAPVPWGLPAR